jgi:hypothetical protein
MFVQAYDCLLLSMLPVGIVNVDFDVDVGGQASKQVPLAPDVRFWSLIASPNLSIQSRHVNTAMIWSDNVM